MVTVSTDASQDESLSLSRPRCVHTITDRFSATNTYLINEDRLLVVDPVSETQVQLLAHYIQAFLRRSLADIDMVVLTHLQQDHSNGLQALRRLTTAPVAASSIAAVIVRQEQQASFQRIGMFSGLHHHVDSFAPLYTRQLGYVDTWLQDVGSIPLHADWRIIASPGRSPESLCLFNPFTHELLAGNTIVVTERHTPVLQRGRSRNQLYQTLSILRNLPIHYLYSAHGPQIMRRAPLAFVQIEQ